MTTLTRIVVVGNGIAGVTAADTLRADGFDGELTLVGDERHAAYSRPALSKALLRDERRPHVPSAVRRRRTARRELLGVSAAGLDVDGRAVLLDDGTGCPTTGWSSPRAAGRAGWARRGRAGGELTLRTLDDALAAARPHRPPTGGRRRRRRPARHGDRVRRASTPAARSPSSPRDRRWRASWATTSRRSSSTAARARGSARRQDRRSPPGGRRWRHRRRARRREQCSRPGSW